MNTTRYRKMLVWAGLAIATFNGGLPAATASPQSVEQTSAKQKTVHMRIAGMTCAACAKGLEASFKNMAGVAKASVDYKAGEAVITFDPAKQTTESLSKFVTKCGYQVKEAKVA
jgi:copper chaperone CopZ